MPVQVVGDFPKLLSYDAVFGDSTNLGNPFAYSFAVLSRLTWYMNNLHFMLT